MHSQVHQFNPAVLHAYYNLDKYKHIKTDDYLIVTRIKDHQVFVYNNDVDIYSLPLTKKKAVFYFLEPYRDEKCQEIKEFLYNLDELFTEPNKQIRRALKVENRTEAQPIDPQDLQYLFRRWEENKRANPKVFQLIFEPKRYQRSFELDKKFDTFSYEIKVKGKPYGAIVFALDGDTAYELAFVSLYFDKELKIVNDLNESLIIGAFHSLWELGYKYVNPGFDGGMKGLNRFKSKIDHTTVSYYKLKVDLESLGNDLEDFLN